MRAVVALFLKEPRAGAVKTRLIPALGAPGAAALYGALAEAVVAATRPGPSDYDRLFFYTPAEARAASAWFPGELWPAQEGEDLGARMSSAFDKPFRRGADRTHAADERLTPV